MTRSRDPDLRRLDVAARGFHADGFAIFLADAGDLPRDLDARTVGANGERIAFYFPGDDSGFGLGFAVRTVATTLLPAGEYRWDSAGGALFFIDPRDDMFAIVMMQTPSQRGRIQTDVKKLIYEALKK